MHIITQSNPADIEAIGRYRSNFCSLFILYWVAINVQLIVSRYKKPSEHYPTIKRYDIRAIIINNYNITYLLKTSSA